MAAKKTTKKTPAKAKAPWTPEVAIASLTEPEQVLAKQAAAHDETHHPKVVWSAKVAIASMSAAELDEFEANFRSLVLHGPGVVGAITARREVLAG